MPRDGQSLTLTDLVAKHCALGRQKRCPRCGEDWPHDEEFYYPNARRSSGFNAWCRACDCEAMSERRQNRRKAA